MSQQEDLAPTLQSPPDLHQITIRAEGPVISAHTRQWKVFVTNQGTGRNSALFTLQDPFNEDEYQQVRWYVEEFAIGDPFAQARAETVTQSQLRYGKQLVSAIRPFINEVLGIQPEDASACSWIAIHLRVHGNGTESSLHSLLWEIMERIECCNPPTFFTITRIVERDPNDLWSILPGRQPSNSEHFRILYVSARPGLENDISYRAISRHIWELLKRTDGQRPRISLDFVRPGTWTKFCSVLKDRKGHYDLVHFDMHGTISKRLSIHKALIHFASVGGASKKPDSKSAETVAKVLRESAVRAVVLNACTSATPSSSIQGNFACALVSHGMAHVAAMTFKVKTDAAVIAMKSIYSTLLGNRGNLLKAARCAREELRRVSSRSGRYGLNIMCKDEINFVYYSADVESNTCDFGFADIVGLPRSTLSSEERLLLRVDEGSHPPEITRIQDLDILLAEESLEVSTVMFLGGESGTGKTTLARRMSNWWKETAFAGDVPHFQALDDLQAWLKSRKAFEESSDHKNERLPNHESPDYEAIILLDNPESYDPWPQNSKECKGLHCLNDIIEKCLKSVAGVRVIVFTRLDRRQLSGISVDVLYHAVSTPSVEEAAAVAAFYASQYSTDTFDQIKAAETEEVIKLHRMNFDFLHTFMPRQAELKRPPLRFIDELLGDPTLCDFEALRNLIEGPSSKSTLKIAHDRIQSWPLQTDASHRLILTICMFQGQFPKDPRLWLRKLLEQGPIGQKLMTKPYPVESGEIHYWDLGDGWGNFPEEWKFEESWEKIQDCLLSLGLMYKDQKEGLKGTEMFRLHPLLPYMLRYGVCKLRNVFSSRSLDVYWPRLRQTYWEYYECRAIDLVIAWLEDPNARLEIVKKVNDDLANVYEAVTLSLTRLHFPYRRIRIYDVVSWINFASMPQLHLKRWSHLLERTLSRFESILDNQEWMTNADGAKIPPEDRRGEILTIAVQLGEYLGTMYEAMGYKEAVIANTDRTMKIKTSFTANSVAITPIAVTRILYALRVQAAQAIPPSKWSQDDLSLFTELLLSDTVNTPTGSESATRAQISRASLVVHLSYERQLIPADHPLQRALQDIFECDTKLISNVYAKHPGLSQLQSLGGRDFIAYPVNAKDPGSSEIQQRYTSREYAVESIRRIQKDFHQRPASNSRDYSNDAIAYAMDPDAIVNGDHFIFDAERLREVYEIAKQVRDLRNQVFFLQQLKISAQLDGEVEAAQRYEETWREIGGWKIAPPDIFDNSLKQNEFSEVLLRTVEEARLRKEQKRT